MKKFLIPTLALMLATSASADSYPYLSFQTADGSVVSLSSNGLNLTVEGSQLVAQNEEGSSKFALADLSRMFFSKQVETSIADLSLDDASHTLQVYTTAGVLVGRFDSERSLRRNVSPGIYVVKKNGRTLKMAVE